MFFLFLQCYFLSMSRWILNGITKPAAMIAVLVIEVETVSASVRPSLPMLLDVFVPEFALTGGRTKTLEQKTFVVS